MMTAVEGYDVDDDDDDDDDVMSAVSTMHKMVGLNLHKGPREHIA